VFRTSEKFLVDSTNGTNDSTNGRAIGIVLCPSSVCNVVYIVAKRCVLEQKLLLTVYRKSHIGNQLVPK